MASDSSGFSFHKLQLVGFLIGLLPIIAGVISVSFLGGSLEDMISWILASVFLSLVLIVLNLVGVFKKQSDEISDSPGSETLTFSLPIYSQVVRPPIAPEFRERLNKNRKDQISEIKQHLSGGKRGLIITGVKGVGKSTLAAYFAEGDDFWLDFVGKTIDLKTLLIILAQWAGDEGFEGHLQQCAKVGENEINYLCEKLSGFKRKLFFDNLETLLDKSTRRFKETGVSLFFYKLLKTDHQCQVLITSRIMPVLNEGGELEDEEGVVKVKSGGLSDKDGAELLREEGVEETEESPLESISREVDGNPLLLKQLIPIVRRPSVGGSLNKLKQWKEKYKGEILEAILKEEATEAGRDLIFRMSVVADPLTIEQVRVLREEEDTDNVVDDLVGRSLMEWDEERKLFWLHPAVKETAEGELERKPKLLRLARRSALIMYLEIVKGLKPQEEWKSIEDCAPLVRSAEIILDLGEFENAAVLIVDIIHEPLFRWGQWNLLKRFYARIIPELERLSKKTRKNRLLYLRILNNYGLIRLSFCHYEEASAYFINCFEIAKEIGNRSCECNAYGNLGNAYQALGEYRKAIEYHEKSLEIALEIGDRRGEGATYGNLGNAYDSLGDFSKAIEYHEKQLNVDLEIGDRRGEGHAYCNLGNAFQALGEYKKAIEYHEKLLEIALETGDRSGEGAAYGNLGNAYHSLGEYHKAIEYHEKRLKVALEIGDRQGECNAFGNLGIAYKSLGEYRKAIVLYEKCFEIAIEIGDRRGEGNAYGNLGNAYFSLGDYVKAIEFQVKNLEVASEIGDRHGEGVAYGNLCNAYQSLGEYGKAIEYHKKHLNTALEIGDRRGEGYAYGNLGVVYFYLGDYDKAIELHEKLLNIAKEIGDRRGEGNAYGNLGNAYHALGDYNKAIEYQEKRLEIAQEIGDLLGEGASYGNLGIVYNSLGKNKKAIEYHEKHLKVAQEIGDRQGEGNAYSGLGNVHSKLEKHEKALEYFRKALLIQNEIKDAQGTAISCGNIARELLFIGNYAEAASNGVNGLMIATEIGVPEAGWLASLTKECREKLGAEEFRSVAVKIVGEEKAGEVERILAEIEEGED